MDFETIVIGSSPVSLMNAFMRHQAGEHVKIVERDTEIGGVWKTGIAFGIAGVETTPHFFLPDPAGYAALRQILPHEYESFGSPAYMHIIGSPSLGTRKVPLNDSFEFHSSILATTYLDAVQKSRWRRSKRYAKAMIRLMAKSPFRPATTQPIYPVGGMASWLKSMERHASHLGITIEKHRTIVSVRETSDGVEIIDAEGKRDSARRLVLSGRTLLDQIELQNGTFDLEPIEIESHHYSLAIKNQAPSGLVHYLGHPKLFLVNDVTRFAPAQFEEQYPGHRLIVARTVYRSGPKPTGAEVVEALKETEYLSNAAISNAENHWHLRQRFLSRNCLRALQNRMPTKVSVLSTADLDIVGAAARMMLAKP